MTFKKLFLKILLLAVACAFLFGCSGDDDSGNSNCPKPGAIEINELNSSSVLFTWGVNEQTAWEIEYGLAGFSLGSGTVDGTSETEYFIDGLDAATAYDIYVRANCGSDGFSDHVQRQVVTTEASIACNTPTDLFLADVGSDFAEIGWAENNETAWEVEYGETGFTLGTGTVIPTSNSTIVIGGLSPATTYEIYVRANCGSDGFSEYSQQLVVTTNN